jgi:hypothetical protein
VEHLEESFVGVVVGHGRIGEGILEENSCNVNNCTLEENVG